MVPNSKRSAALFSVFIFCLLLPLSADAETLKGYFVTWDGRTQVVGEFTHLNNAFPCEYNGNNVEIPTSSIKKILVVDADASPDKILITKRDGKEFLVLGGLHDLMKYYNDGAQLAFTFYNEINETYDKDIVRWNAVSTIVFDDDYGDLRKNPKTGRTYPPDYLFDPYDKTPLILVPVVPGQSSSQTSSQAPAQQPQSQAAAQPASASHANQQTGGGQASATGQAPSATQLAVDTLNPMVSPEQLGQELNDYARQITGQ